MISSIYLFDLLDSLAPGVVNWKLVSMSPPKSSEEACTNARYAISVANKLGCVVFATYEDIIEGNKKMIILLLAAIMATTV